LKNLLRGTCVTYVTWKSDEEHMCHVYSMEKKKWEFYIQLLHVLYPITIALTFETFTEGYICHVRYTKMSLRLNLLHTTTYVTWKWFLDWIYYIQLLHVLYTINIVLTSETFDHQMTLNIVLTSETFDLVLTSYSANFLTFGYSANFWDIWSLLRHSTARKRFTYIK